MSEYSTKLEKCCKPKLSREQQFKMELAQRLTSRVESKTKSATFSKRQLMITLTEKLKMKEKAFPGALPAFPDKFYISLVLSLSRFLRLSCIYPGSQTKQPLGDL